MESKWKAYLFILQILPFFVKFFFTEIVSNYYGYLFWRHSFFVQLTSIHKITVFLSHIQRCNADALPGILYRLTAWLQYKCLWLEIFFSIQLPILSGGGLMGTHYHSFFDVCRYIAAIAIASPAALRSVPNLFYSTPCPASSIIRMRNSWHGIPYCSIYSDRATSIVYCPNGLQYIAALLE